MVQKNGDGRNAAEPRLNRKFHPRATPHVKIEDGLPPRDAATGTRAGSTAENDHALSQVRGRESGSDCLCGGYSLPTPINDKGVGHDRQENGTSLFRNMAAACSSGIQPSAVICMGKDADYWIVTEANPHPRELLMSDPAVSKLVRDLFIGKVERHAASAQDLDDPKIFRLKSKPSHTADGTNGSLDFQSSINFVRSPSQGEKQTFAEEHPDDEDDEESDGAEILECKQVEVDRIRIDEVGKSYYAAAIGTMSQRALKDILTAWIRVCHPRKQSQHPYSGGKLAQRSLAEYGYEGHYTMPSYWPSDVGWANTDSDIRGCRHKEPYHIKKLECHTLFIHLLQYGSPFNIEQMRESTSTLQQKSPREFPDATMDRLREIYRVRELEMNCESNEMDGDTSITIRKLHGTVNRKTSLSDDFTVTKSKTSRSRPQNSSSTTETPTELIDVGSEYSGVSAPRESSSSINGVNTFAGRSPIEATDHYSQSPTSPAAEERSSRTAWTPSTDQSGDTEQRAFPTRAQMRSCYPSPTPGPYASTPGGPRVNNTQLHHPIAVQGHKRPLSPSIVSTYPSPFADTGNSHDHREPTKKHGRTTSRHQRKAPHTQQAHIRPLQLHQPRRQAPASAFSFAGSSSGFSGLDTSAAACATGPITQQHAPSIRNPFYNNSSMPEAALPSAAAFSLHNDLVTTAFDSSCIDFGYSTPDQQLTSHFQQQHYGLMQAEQLRQLYPTILSSNFESFDFGATTQDDLLETDWLDQTALYQS